MNTLREYYNTSPKFKLAMNIMCYVTIVGIISALLYFMTTSTYNDAHVGIVVVVPIALLVFIIALLYKGGKDYESYANSEDYSQDTKIKMYSAPWCPNCSDAKEAISIAGPDVSSKITIVEENVPEDIHAFPTFEVDGKIDEEMTVEDAIKVASN